MGYRIMDDQLCRRYFQEPQWTFHRRYVASLIGRLGDALFATDVRDRQSFGQIAVGFT